MRIPSPTGRAACALHAATVAPHHTPLPTVHDVIGATRGLYRLEISEAEALAAIGRLADERDAKSASSPLPGYPAI